MPCGNMKLKLPKDFLSRQDEDSYQDKHPEQYLPVPVPPETKYSVLVPITVDRVGINKHLETRECLRSLNHYPTSGHDISTLSLCRGFTPS